MVRSIVNGLKLREVMRNFKNLSTTIWTTKLSS